MSIAVTLKEYLTKHRLDFELIEHPRTASTMRSAEVAHIPGDQMAKGVLLGDDQSYLLAVIPATHRLEIDRLNQLLGRTLELMPETEVIDALADCEPGSVPPLGTAYGIDTVVEEGLLHQSDVYFESGDHSELIHVSGKVFSDMMSDAEAHCISYHL